jgi:hypothetical protein
MQSFKLVLKNEKTRQYQVFAMLLILLNCAVLAFMAFSNPAIRYRCLASIALILLLFAAGNYFSKEGRKINAKAGAAFILVLTYAGLGYWTFTGAALLSGALYVISVRKLTVVFRPDHISYPFVFNKTIHWQELSNVILKDGLLTIDFKNNRIIQQLIDKTYPSANEKEFNEFCRSRLIVPVQI